jgi:hypothetical protein
MLSTIHSRVTHFIALILMLTGIGGLLAWLLPTHCLHSLGILPPFQRALRQYVGNPEAINRLYAKLRQQPAGNHPFDYRKTGISNYPFTSNRLSKN